MIAEVMRQIFRAVFGGGTDISAVNPMPVSLTGPVGYSHGLCYYGVVTAIPGANQFTIPTLAGLGAGKFGDAVSPYYAFVLRDAGGASAAPQGEMAALTAYNTATGTFTAAGFTAAVGVGDEILIINPRVAEQGLSKGMYYHGRVDAIPGANQFQSGKLAGLGAGKFIGGGINAYWVFVLRDAGGAGAAPQGEIQIVTAYNTLTGAFTTAAFTAPIAVGDEVLIVNPMIAYVLVGLPAALGYIIAIQTQVNKLAGEVPVTGFTTANWQSGVAPSGETGAQLVTIGANDTRYKLHSLIISIHALTAGAVIIVKMFQQVNGTERKVYQQNFVQGTSPNGLWIVDASVGIHEVLRVEIQSDTAADNGLAVHYDYSLEAQ